MRAAVLLLAIVAVGCPNQGGNQPAVTTTTAATVYLRADLEQKLAGKTKDEVIALLGKPESTSGGEEDSWQYKGITRDPVTGKTDSLTWVWFDRAGKVTRLHYL